MGVHPPGGFVAWPGEQHRSGEEQEQYELRKRKRERTGFVAWPEKKVQAGA
jgi:hypothetical protein